ncbi:MAG: phosphatase PAP2 family protein [Verrucomicrobiota bacterium]
MKFCLNLKSRHSLAIASAICLTLALLWFGSAVSAGRFQSFDDAVLKQIRQLNYPFGLRGTSALAQLFVVFSYMGTSEWLFAVSAIAAATFLWRARYWEAAFLIAALPVSGVMMRSLKLFYARARPEVIEHFQVAYGFSYPSGHALLSMAVYLILAMQIRRELTRPMLRGALLLFAFLIIFAVGVSRVYLGVHFPTDVLAGWAFGLLFAIVYWNLGEAFRAKAPQVINRARSSSISARGKPPRSS